MVKALLPALSELDDEEVEDLMSKIELLRYNESDQNENTKKALNTARGAL